jgi:hypothetical protein
LSARHAREIVAGIQVFSRHARMYEAGIQEFEILPHPLSNPEERRI